MTLLHIGIVFEVPHFEPSLGDETTHSHDKHRLLLDKQPVLASVSKGYNLQLRRMDEAALGQQARERKTRNRVYSGLRDMERKKTGHWIIEVLEDLIDCAGRNRRPALHSALVQALRVAVDETDNVGMPAKQK